MATAGASPTYFAASYKGAPFRVRSSDDAFGRRGYIYEYPMRDTPGYKDAGRKIRKYSILGYIVGGDHVARTHPIIAAVESAGPGILVHPLLGSVMVACEELRVGVGYIDAQRVTTLAFTFIEANAIGAPFNIASTLGMLTGGISDLVSAALGNLGLSWDGSIAAIATAQSILGLIQNWVMPTAGDTASLDAMDLLTLATTDQSTIIQGAALYSFIQTGLNAIAGNADPAVAFARLQQVTTAAAVTVSPTQYSAAAINSVLCTTRLTAAALAAQAAYGKTYSTISDAITDLNWIVSIFDAEAAIISQSCDDVFYKAAVETRSTAIGLLLAQNISLPGMVSMDMRGQFPSLVMAYERYEDATRAGELEGFNPNSSPLAMLPNVWGKST